MTTDYLPPMPLITELSTKSSRSYIGTKAVEPPFSPVIFNWVVRI